MISTLKESPLRLRPMKESDLAQVLEIEKYTFPDPWPESSFRECLKFGYCCRVLEHESIIQAYGIMAIEVHNAHILNLCVRPEFRHRNRGRKMLTHLLEEAQGAQVDTVFLEVRSSNQPAIKLYQAMGFFQVGIRKGYYRALEGGEDALILAWRPSRNSPQEIQHNLSMIENEPL